MKKNFTVLIELVNKLSSNLSISDKEKLAITEIPELQKLKDTICQHPYHKYEDILEHSLESLRLVQSYVTNEDNYSNYDIAILKIILLLHDTGKAVSKTSKDGIDHFYGHPIKGAEIANNILNRYAIDDKTKITIIDMIKLHDNYISYDNDEGLREVIKRFGLKETGMLLKIQRADINTHSDIYIKKTYPMMDKLDTLYKIIKNSQD